MHKLYEIKNRTFTFLQVKNIYSVVGINLWWLQIAKISIHVISTNK